MVTRGDAEWSIYQGLRSLPRRPYLVAMWILCGELRILYAPWTRGEKVLTLMASTVDLVREAAISGEPAELARRALDLGRPGNRSSGRPTASTAGYQAAC
jgi:hypothetical protein